MLNKTIDEEPVCMKILITKGKMLPFSIHNVRIYNFS